MFEFNLKEFFMFKKLLSLALAFLICATQSLCSGWLPEGFEQAPLDNPDSQDSLIKKYMITWTEQPLYYELDCANLHSDDMHRITGNTAGVSYGIYMIVNCNGYKGLFVIDNFSPNTTLAEIESALVTEANQSYDFFTLQGNKDVTNQSVELNTTLAELGATLVTEENQLDDFFTPQDMEYDTMASLEQNEIGQGIWIYAALRSSATASQEEIIEIAKWYRNMLDWINYIISCDNKYLNVSFAINNCDDFLREPIEAFHKDELDELGKDKTEARQSFQEFLNSRQEVVSQDE